MTPAPPHVAVIIASVIIWLVCSHTDHDGRLIVAEASSSTSFYWHGIIGKIVVRRWAHIVEIV